MVKTAYNYSHIYTVLLRNAKKEDKNQIKEIRDRVFANIIRQPQMIAITQRNESGNYIIDTLAKNQIEDEPEEDDTWQKKLKDALKIKEE